MTSKKVRLVTLRGQSLNRKLAPQSTNRFTTRAGWKPVAPFVMTTTVPIAQSCPETCAFFAPAKNGIRPCYVDASVFTRSGVRLLEQAAEGLTPEDIARAEAGALDRMYAKRIPQDGARGGRDLRLHVAGDCRTDEAARIVSDAVGRWKKRGGGTAWTYTHAWRTVKRASWGEGISVWASCESLEDVHKARARGYGAVLVVADPHPKDGRARQVGDLRILPCVAETHDDVTCASCRICLDRDLHKLGIVVAFSSHGQHIEETKRRVRLQVLKGTNLVQRTQSG